MADGSQEHGKAGQNRDSTLPAQGRCRYKNQTKAYGQTYVSRPFFILRENYRPYHAHNIHRNTGIGAQKQKLQAKGQRAEHLQCEQPPSVLDLKGGDHYKGGRKAKELSYELSRAES